MRLNLQLLRLIGPSLTLLLGLLIPSAALRAQQGLRSGIARVALVARVAPRAAFPEVRLSRQVVRADETKSSAVSVRLSANSRYRLVVLSTAGPSPTSAPRLWVRDSDGVFQPLRPGSSVTVLQGAYSGGEIEREVRYRMDASDAVEAGLRPLPVRYEIRIDPII